MIQDSVVDMKNKYGQVLLKLSNVSKTFHGNVVLSGVNLQLRAGQIHSLVGMNGSGKSTLIKILAGVYSADRGSNVELAEVGLKEITTTKGQASGWFRHALSMSNVTEQQNIGFVHQDLGLIPDFTLLENFQLTAGTKSKLESGRGIGEVRDALRRVGIHSSPFAKLATLGSADRSLFAIARALYQLRHLESPILVLDEPTASLPKHESQRVLETMRQLAEDGAAVLFVSHHLSEVLEVSDHVTALRDGVVTASVERSELSEAILVNAILGEELEQIDQQGELERNIRYDRTPVVKIEDVRSFNLHGVSLEAYPGEVLAITGLVGCGKSQLGRILAGATRKFSGETTYFGQVQRASIEDSLEQGIAYVPAERKTAGGVGDFTLSENVSLSTLERLSRFAVLDRRAEYDLARHYIDVHQIRPPLTEQVFSAFSGGNQQKIVMGRAMASEPKLLVVDEPTQGVDVGAIALLYQRITQMAAHGGTVIVISSSFEEVSSIADRAILLDKGRQVGELNKSELSVEALINLSLTNTNLAA